MKPYVIALPLAVLLVSCSESERMTAPPSEPPAPLLVPPAVADATVHSDIVVTDTPEELVVAEPADVTVEPSDAPPATATDTDTDTQAFFHLSDGQESIDDIAAHYGVDPARLADINRARGTLAAGRVILLPRNLNDIPVAPDIASYTVVSGDTYSRIARTYAIDTKALMHLNNATDPMLQIGDVLYVPDVSGR